MFIIITGLFSTAWYICSKLIDVACLSYNFTFVLAIVKKFVQQNLLLDLKHLTVVSSTKLCFFLFLFPLSVWSFDVTAFLDFSYACTFTAVRDSLDNEFGHCCNFLFYGSFTLVTICKSKWWLFLRVPRAYKKNKSVCRCFSTQISSVICLTSQTPFH